MKLHFEDNLDYQLAAIESTVNLFRGQDINRTEFTVSKLSHPAGQNKKGGWQEPERTAKGVVRNNETNKKNAERAYNLIMKDKEKLLSFDSKLKFIFSHSALREGWDNPNVFQICALRDMGT